MDTTDFPDRSEFPYRALIRIRYQYELDALLIRQLQHAVAATATKEVSAEFESATSKLAFGLLQSERTPVSTASLGSAFVAFDEDGPLCPPTLDDTIAALIRWLIEHGVPVPTPPDPPVYLKGDLALVVLAARDAIPAIASPEVAEQLLANLDGVTNRAFELVS